jgi:hypothetical protein
MIRLASLLLRLVVSAYSFVWWLFCLALVFSGRLGNMVVIDEGGSGESL